MCRLLSMCCVLGPALLENMESAYAQNSVTVPVMITLEASSTSKTAPPPTLVVDPTELTVQTGGIGGYYVQLSSIPTGPVSVTYRVTDVPTGGDEDHLDFSPESLSFTTTNWEGQRFVTVDAATNALEGEYTIELTSSGGGVMDTETVTVTVEEGLTLSPIPLIEVEVGRSSGPWGLSLVVTSGQPGWGTVTTTLSIREPGDDYVSVQPSTLTYTVDEYNSSKSVTFTATADAVPGDYTLVQTASRVGYNDIQREGTIRIVRPCIVTISKKSDLNFGQWIKPEGSLRGDVTVDAATGTIDGTNMNAAGGTPSVAKLETSATNCACELASRTRSRPWLTGRNSRQEIAFDWTLAINGVRRYGAVEGGASSLEAYPSSNDNTYQIGGIISGITSATTPDDYRGRILFEIFCR